MKGKKKNFWKQLFFVAFFVLGPGFFTQAARVPNDPFFSQEWYLERIGIPKAWETSVGSSEVIVAVLDSGVDLDHLDLVGNLWTNPGEIPGDGRDNDNNGYVDDLHGWDFVGNDADPRPDLSGSYDEAAASHGTLIAGIIGAVTNNGEGVAGINWNVRILPVRMLDAEGTGDATEATKAVAYARAAGADVINLSFTGLERDEVFFQALEEAARSGTVIVAAVGNTSGGGTNLDEKSIYPACFVASDGFDPVIGVAATDKDDRKASFSNYGAACTDLAAPGTDLIGAMAEGAYGGLWSGTSLAAPMVSGAAALLKAVYPSLTAEQTKTILQLSVEPVQLNEDGSSVPTGAGRLNAAQALEIARSFVFPSPTMAPSVRTEGFVTAEGPGSVPLVKRFDASGRLEKEWNAYGEKFLGGVSLAVGDVDGDGVAEVVTGAGVGGGPQVRIFDRDGKIKGQFFAFDVSERTGISLSLGNVSENEGLEILVTRLSGGDGEVRFFSRTGERIGSIFPFGFIPGGFSLAAGDMDKDGIDELVVGSGNGKPPTVRVLKTDGHLFGQFSAYDPLFVGGVHVSVGDVDGDGMAEIITGAGVGGGPQVRIFDRDGKVLRQQFVFPETDRLGVMVAGQP